MRRNKFGSILLACLSVALLNDLFHFDRVRFALPPKILKDSQQAQHPKSRVDSKPTFILHAGPHKTGTTFLQSLLSRFHKHEALRHDNYTYMGTFAGVPLKSIPAYGWRHSKHIVFTANVKKLGYVFDEKVDEINQNHTFTPAFVRSIEVLKEMNASILFIYEGLVHVDHKRLQSLYDLLVPHWNVDVILTYRPFHEFIISYYNQLEKSEILYHKSSLSRSIAPFDISVEDAMLTGDAVAIRVAEMFPEFVETKRKHPVQAISGLFEPFFGPVSILRPDNPSPSRACDPLLDSLLCFGRSDMPHMCQACQQGEFNDKVPSNPSFELNYAMLAAAAYHAGMMPNMVGSKAAEKLREHHEITLGRSVKDLPLVCLSQEKLDRLERASMDMEEQVFGTRVNVTEFHERFAAMKDRFCSIDTKRALEDPVWRDFFSNMTAPS